MTEAIREVRQECSATLSGSRTPAIHQPVRRACLEGAGLEEEVGHRGQIVVGHVLLSLGRSAGQYFSDALQDGKVQKLGSPIPENDPAIAFFLIHDRPFPVPYLNASIDLARAWEPTHLPQEPLDPPGKLYLDPGASD
jgi:hypothetical protein